MTQYILVATQLYYIDFEYEFQVYYFKYAETKMKKYRKLAATSDSRLEFTIISKQIISFNF